MLDFSEVLIQLLNHQIIPLFSVQELETKLCSHCCATVGWHNIAVWFAQIIRFRFRYENSSDCHDLKRPLNKGQGYSFWYQLISHATSYRLSIVTCSRTHRLATIHNVTDDGDREMQHYKCDR